jgi:hypothetical protein
MKCTSILTLTVAMFLIVGTRQIQAECNQGQCTPRDCAAR